MIERIVELMRDRRVAVLTGAGCSTDSGIPDYRGPRSAPPKSNPIQYQEFVRSEEARVRYWSRSSIGWPRIACARPNAGHKALAELERDGVAHGIITQNVDGLHSAAGSSNVVELHGTLAVNRCLSCNDRTARADFQHKLLELNPAWAERFRGDPLELAPDGDAHIEPPQDFRVPACVCGGILKPDVVFFGENVPSETVQRAWEIFDVCDMLLVVGSSLTVYSGRRFVYRAQQQNKPVAIINLGPTRGDDTAAVKVDAPIGEILPLLTARLGS